MNEPRLPIEFRPRILPTARMFMVVIAGLITFHILLRLAGYPYPGEGIQILGAVFAFSAILLLMASRYVRITSNGIETATLFFRKSCSWPDIDEWAYGEREIALRLKANKIIRLTDDCIFAERTQILCDILAAHVGAGTKVANAVPPPMSEEFVGDRLNGDEFEATQPIHRFVRREEPTNAPNPYESPLTKATSYTWLPVDSFATGLWLAIPIVALIGRLLLLPSCIYLDVALPVTTDYLLSGHAPVFLLVVSLVVLRAMFGIPISELRRRFRLAAIIVGMIVGSAYLLSFIHPLVSLWHKLS